MTNCRVYPRAVVEPERLTADSCVVATGCVIMERIPPAACIFDAGCVARKGERPIGRVFLPGSVVNKRIITEKRVVVAGVATVLTSRSRLR